MINTSVVFVGVTKKEGKVVFAMHIPERKYRVIMTPRQWFAVKAHMDKRVPVLSEQEYTARVGRLRAIAHRSGPPARRKSR